MWKAKTNLTQSTEFSKGSGIGNSTSKNRSEGTAELERIVESVTIGSCHYKCRPGQLLQRGGLRRQCTVQGIWGILQTPTSSPGCASTMFRMGKQAEGYGIPRLPDGGSCSPLTSHYPRQSVSTRKYPSLAKMGQGQVLHTSRPKASQMGQGPRVEKLAR